MSKQVARAAVFCRAGHVAGPGSRGLAPLERAAQALGRRAHPEPRVRGQRKVFPVHAGAGAGTSVAALRGRRLRGDARLRARRRACEISPRAGAGAGSRATACRSDDGPIRGRRHELESRAGAHRHAHQSRRTQRGALGVAAGLHQGGAGEPGHGELDEGGLVGQFQHRRVSLRRCIDSAGEVAMVRTFIDSPVLGDTPIDCAIRDYRDFGGVRFPAHIERQVAGCRGTTSRSARCASMSRRHSSVPAEVAANPRRPYAQST